jgi:hypothetical protein
MPLPIAPKRLAGVPTPIDGKVKHSATIDAYARKIITKALIRTSKLYNSYYSCADL